MFLRDGTLYAAEPATETTLSKKRGVSGTAWRSAFFFLSVLCTFLSTQSHRIHTDAKETNRRRVNPLPELDNPPSAATGSNDEDPAPVILPTVPAGVYLEMPNGALELALPETDVVIDDRSQYGVWDGKYLTRLPFIPSKDDPDINALSFVSPVFNCVI